MTPNINLGLYHIVSNASFSTTKICLITNNTSSKFSRLWKGHSSHLKKQDSRTLLNAAYFVPERRRRLEGKDRMESMGRPRPSKRYSDSNSNLGLSSGIGITGTKA